MVGQNEERDSGWYYADRKISGKPVLRLRFRCKYNPGYPPHQLLSNASLRLIGLREQLLWFYPLKQTKKGYYDLASYCTISNAVSAVKSRFTKTQKPRAFGLVSVALLELNSVKISDMKREETAKELPTISEPVPTSATDILIEQNNSNTEVDTNGRTDGSNSEGNESAEEHAEPDAESGERDSDGEQSGAAEPADDPGHIEETAQAENPKV